MDDGDKILVEELQNVGIKIDMIQQIDSNLLVLSIGTIMKEISKLLGREDFMSSEKLNMALNFDEASNKFQVCQTLVTYVSNNITK